VDPVRLAVRQPVTVIVGIVLIMLAGIVALSRLPIALTPTVQDTIVTVTTFWEGASPEEVEQNVIDKQEERLFGVSDLVQMTSTSSQGFGRIRLQFATGVDKDAALREVAQKLDEVPTYPDNVDQPVIEASDPENRDYIAWVVLKSSDPDVDVREFRDFAIDRIEPALERVPGIAEINVLGGRERELQLRVDPVRLAERGITPSRFADVIRDVNRNVSAGEMAVGKRDLRLRTVSQYATTDEVEATVITDGPGGAVRVGDVAEAVLAYKEPTSFVRSRGRPVIAINADRELDSNVIEVMAALQATIAELNAPGGLLAAESARLGLAGEGLKLEQVYDQTVYIDDALALVRSNIWIGGALAIGVLIIFLRSIRSVGIIALAIPISVIGAVVAMVALGRSINVISLAGMAFAVGMVVDNAIVVLENIFRHLEMGKDRRQAAIDGAREVWGAVLAATLTTIAVFVPILLIESEAGQLFRDIALAICAAVALSLIVSITLIPMAGARLLKAPKKRAAKGRGKAKGQAGNAAAVAVPEAAGRQGIAGVIAGFVHLLLGSRLASLAIIFVLTAASVAGTVYLRPASDYLPTGNRNLSFGLMIPPPGYNLEQREEIGRRVEDVIRPFWEAGQMIDEPAEYDRLVAALPEIPTFNFAAGAPGPPVTPPSLENYFFVSFENILFHGAISDEPRRVPDVVALMNNATGGQAAPGVIAFAFQVPLFQLGGNTGSAIKLQLSGADLEQVKGVATQLFLAIGGKYGFQSVQPDPANFTLRTPEIRVEPDLVRLSELGLGVRDVALAVQVVGDGAIVDEFSVGGETIDLKVIAGEAVGRNGMEDLLSLPIATPSGRVVTLGSVARVLPVEAPQEIARVGRQRSVSLQVTPPVGVPLEAVVRELETMVADLRASGAMPASIRSEVAGSAGKLREVQQALLGDGTLAGTIGSSLVLALMVVYLLMCVLFQNFLRPLVIMFSVPLATLGGFLGLAVVHWWSIKDPYSPIQNLDVLTMLGFVLLIGVVVNNAILIVHQAGNFLEGRADVNAADLAAWGGSMTPRTAIAMSVRSRVRPIFMGTLTSVGGMLPLVLMPGAGSELYRGLGSVVVGGLVMSTVFTLLLVPLLLGFVLRPVKDKAPSVRPAAAGAAAKPQTGGGALAGATTAGGGAGAASPARR
jgi:HAE1 family hydrophobic/amphiphilic exporter-1